MIQYGTKIGVSAFSLSVVLAAGVLGDEPSPKLKMALSYVPRQPDVVYEEVEEAQMGDCSLDQTSRADGKGFWVTGPSGQPLRWFADTDGDNKLDRWSYYNGGVEVYREIDTDANKVADEFRWLSTSGLRWGVDRDEDGEIDAWKIISAEEVTAEIVAATASRDANRFTRLLLTPADIQSLGLGEEKAKELQQSVADAQKQFQAWAAGQNVVTRSSKWTNFGADKPGIVPAGTNGAQKDIVVYENVVALLEEAGVPKQLLVGTMIRVGDSWRIVDLPRAVSEGAVVSDAGRFFSVAFNDRGSSVSAPTVEGGISKAMEGLVTELQAVDEKLMSAGGDKESLHARRANVLEKLVAESESSSDRAQWIRQFADTVSAATQAGEYAGGVRRLKDFASKLSSVNASDDELAYVEFRTLSANHNYEMQQPKAEFEKLQKQFMSDLVAFVRKYPRATDSAEAMLQLGTAAEFSGETDTAKSWYDKAAKGFESTLAGRKAAGALKRLNLPGERFSVVANRIDGESFSSNAYRGSPVIYHCWASWCDGCKAEMRALKQLQDKYAKTNLKIVGINFDNDPQRGISFLRENSYPWVHLHGENGLDGDLAVENGFLTLPVNVVVDASGKVVATGVYWPDLDEVIEKIAK